MTNSHRISILSRALKISRRYFGALFSSNKVFLCIKSFSPVTAPPRPAVPRAGAPQLWKIDCACYIFLQISSITYICPKMCAAIQRKSLFIMKWVLCKQFSSKLSRVCTTCKISQTLNCPVKSFLLEKSDALTVKGGGSENIWRPGQFLWAASENTKLSSLRSASQRNKN